MSHPDLDGLSDVLAGADDAHVAGCPACSARLAGLRVAHQRTAGELARAADRDPEPMPADVVARLEAALRSEPGRGATVTTLPVRSGTRRRWAPAAAAAAVLLAAAAGLAVLRPGGGTNATSAGPQDAAGSRPGALAGLRISSTGSAYGKDGSALRRELPGLLRGEGQEAAAKPAGPATGPVSGAAPLADPLGRLRTTPGLAACLSTLLPAKDLRVLALDYARFEGSPALVVVVPSTAAGKVDTFVVGPDCGINDEQLLFFIRLPRPGG